MGQQEERYKSRKQGKSSTADFKFGKIQPQARDLEEAVLGACMLEKEAYDNIAGILQPECFYVDAHAKIFESMQSLAKKNMPIDLLTVVAELKVLENLDAVGGHYAVTMLTSAVVSSANIQTHAQIVYEKFVAREMIRVTAELHALAYEDSMDIFKLVDLAEVSISDIGLRNLQGEMIGIDRVMMHAVDKISEWMKTGEGITGIPSGFPEIDRATRVGNRET